MKTRWYKDAVVYQIYPRSFCDSNGDGIGDLRGIISKLDYIKNLGVNAVWLSPIYKSPNDDNGYDISNYRDIMDEFGTMADFDEMLAGMHERGIKLIMDLVANHTSDEHEWFVKSRESKDNPYRDYYIWRKGRGKDGRKPPNNWTSRFGGSAWAYDEKTGEWYLHLFSKKQPDLNWENPAVRRALYDMINFWIAEGVAGFRLDVIDQIAKEPDNGITANGPRLMEFLRELNRETFGGKDLVTVGEAWGADLARARQYSAPDGSVFSMVFQFEQMVLDQDGSKWKARPWALPELKASIAKWQQGLHGAGWNSLFWNNHDLPRIVSRWGDDGAHRADSAKALAVVLHGLQGTPYIYQGEELGMTNAPFGPQDWRDLESLNAYRELCQTGTPPPQALAAVQRMARDNARTPMQWTAGPNAGFTTGTPWMRVNPNYTAINAEAALADPASVFYTYQKLIALRKANPVFAAGDFTLLCPGDTQVFAYLRRGGGQTMLVAANLSGQDAAFALPADFAAVPPALATQGAPTPGTLRPWEAAVYIL